MKLPSAALLVAGLVIAGALGIYVVGCGGDESPAPGDGKPGARKSDDLPPWNGTMTVEAMSAEELQQLIAEQKGKVVVVQFWATWDPESMRDGLRGLVKLQRQFGDRVVAIAVNTDTALESPDGAEAKVQPILEKADARFRNVLSTTPDEQLFDSLGLMTFGVVVYDAQGEVAERFNHAVEAGKKGFSYEKDVTPAVRKLLGE